MILLDTHAWFWLAAHPQRLSARARAAIGAALRSGGLGIASVSLVEMAAWMVRGRLLPTGSPETALADLVRTTSVIIKEITPTIAMLAVHFPPELVRDPADRIIAATARAEGLPLVTRDVRLRRSRLVETVW
ncbi:MAG: type II toxin-antitoxin system VapC family toxin [Candidatus Rokubacteria bacterium]|nr:type II toxin-antitoxin system VapC family toxin [Candidatus Rokubacteria bacterium]